MNKTKTANDSDFEKLMDSYLKKDINKFSELIDQGININCLNNCSESFISCMLKQEYDSKMDEFLTILLKNNISLKQIGIEQSLLTIVIERHDNTSCLKKLLENNININCFGMFRFSMGGKQCEDDPAIFHAIEKEDDNSIIDLLIKHNVDLNIENHYRETPLFFLLRSGSFTKNRKGTICVMEKLLKNGADPSILGPDGNTILHYMADCSYGYDMFEILFKYKHKININARNKFGNTALRLAIRNGNYDAVKFLIKKGANLNICFDGGFSLVMLGVQLNQFKILNFILNQSPDLSIVNNFGNNILHLLAKDIKDKKYKTYQKYFNQISKSHPELLDIKNSQGQTPADYCNIIAI